MKRWAFLFSAALGAIGFLALGVWQLERREWKLALIERVEQRVHAAPVAAPGPAQWPTLTRENTEYRRVTTSGEFLDGRETSVRAVTRLGGGFWIMAPLRTSDGFVVLVNRGFVPQEWQHPTTSTQRKVTITGLVRMTEPRGGFLRANDPDKNRWYSRDVTAIAHAQNLSGVAPYFIDAEQSAVRQPVGGLTVIAFRNNHLTYALTWFTLALMVTVFGFRLARLPR